MRRSWLSVQPPRQALSVDLACPIVAVMGRAHHGLPDSSRVIDEQLVGGEPPEAESEHVRLMDAEVVQQAHHVTREMFEGHRPVYVGRTTVALKFDGDNRVGLRRNAMERDRMCHEG